MRLRSFAGVEAVIARDAEGTVPDVPPIRIEGIRKRHFCMPFSIYYFSKNR